MNLMSMNFNDMSIQQQTLNDSIIGLLKNLCIGETQKPNQSKSINEELLLKVFENNSQLSRELTLAYLHYLKPDIFIQDMANKVLDKTILRKLRRTVMNNVFDGDKIHLIHILFCFIEFYMGKPSDAEFSQMIFTKFEIEKIDNFIPKNQFETKLAKQHIKSIISLIFSLSPSFNYQFAYSSKNDEYIINHFINHIEKIITCKDVFYRSYTSKMLFKLFIHSKSFSNVNTQLVKDYMRYCITNKAKVHLLKEILVSAGSYYYQSMILVKWYTMLIKNNDEIEPYSLLESNNNLKDNNKLLYFGDIKSNDSALIYYLFCDSFNFFAALNQMQNALQVFIDELSPSFNTTEMNIDIDTNHLLDSYMIAIVFFNKYISECETLSQIEINKEHYNTRGEAEFTTELTEYHKVLSKSKSAIIQKFFYNNNDISLDNIVNEINQVNDANALLCMLTVIHSIYRKHYYFKQDINFIKEINSLVIQQFFNEMVSHKYYSIYCFSYILETVKLYDTMPDKAAFYSLSELNAKKYSLIYIYYSMYRVMYMMKTNTSIEDIIDFIIKLYDGLMKCVFLPSFTYLKSKMNYIVFTLQLMCHIISGDSGEFTLMYCSLCCNKLKNNGISLSRYLFQCSTCKTLNFVMVLEEEYMKAHIKHNSIQTNIIFPSVNLFIKKLVKTLDISDNFKMHQKYKLIALINQFLITNQNYYKDIVSQEIRDKLILIQNIPITMDNIQQGKDYYQKRKMLKWFSKCEELIHQF